MSPLSLSVEQRGHLPRGCPPHRRHLVRPSLLVPQARAEARLYVTSEILFVYSSQRDSQLVGR